MSKFVAVLFITFLVTVVNGIEEADSPSTPTDNSPAATSTKDDEPTRQARVTVSQVIRQVADTIKRTTAAIKQEGVSLLQALDALQKSIFRIIQAGYETARNNYESLRSTFRKSKDQ